MYRLKKFLRVLKHRVDAAMNYRRVPAPYYQKHALLLDFFPAHASVIETGTYLGETTSVLASHCRQVVTLEPFEPLYRFNRKQFRKAENVKVVNTSSEAGFVSALSEIHGPAGFWLDGHFSGKGTFGNLETASPVEIELCAIGDYVEKNSGSVYVAIDDARLFTGLDGYPSETVIKDFAERFNLDFFKLRDIYFLKSKD